MFTSVAIAAVLVLSGPPQRSSGYLADAIGKATKQVHKTTKNEELIHYFNGTYSLWIDPRNVQFSLENPQIIEARIIVRHEKQDRYMTRDEYLELSRAQVEYDSVSNSYDTQKQAILANKDQRGRQNKLNRLQDRYSPKIDAALKKLNEIKERVYRAANARRDAVENVMVAIESGPNFVSEIYKAKNPVKVQVEVTYAWVDKEPSEIGGKLFVAGVRARVVAVEK